MSRLAVEVFARRPRGIVPVTFNAFACFDVANMTRPLHRRTSASESPQLRCTVQQQPAARGGRIQPPDQAKRAIALSRMLIPRHCPVLQADQGLAPQKTAVLAEGLSQSPANRTPRTRTP